MKCCTVMFLPEHLSIVINRLLGLDKFRVVRLNLYIIFGVTVHLVMLRAVI